jgi:HAMP domain-containing protein
MLSIKTKIVLVVASSVAVGSIAMAWLFNASYQKTLKRASDQALTQARESFATQKKDSVDLMSASILSMEGNRDLIEAFAARDRERLAPLARALYADFSKRFGITHWNYWETEPEGAAAVKGLVNFYRAATPKNFGEFLERATLAEVVREKNLVTGLDLGNTGFALRVVGPVHREGKVVGYFEVGKDIASFLESMKRQSGSEYGLMLIKGNLDEKKWASSRVSRGLRNDWDDMKEFVLATNTSQEASIFAYDRTLQGIPTTGEQLGLVSRSDDHYARAVLPLDDASGKRVGGVFVLTNVTTLYQHATSTRNMALAFIVGLNLLVGLGLVLLFQSLIVRRLDRLVQIVTRVVGGEYQTRINSTSNDEIGRFEKLFDQFREVFVSVVDEANRREQAVANSTPQALG